MRFAENLSRFKVDCPSFLHSPKAEAITSMPILPYLIDVMRVRRGSRRGYGGGRRRRGISGGVAVAESGLLRIDHLVHVYVDRRVPQGRFRGGPFWGDDSIVVNVRRRRQRGRLDRFLIDVFQPAFSGTHSGTGRIERFG